jgi:hypothetical protein
MWRRSPGYRPVYGGIGAVGIIVLILVVWFALHVGPGALILLLLLFLLFA